MPKQLFIILGNGFSMDLLSFISKSESVDVRNLFRYGSRVKWPPDGEPGFLSFKHCPNLWNLGARPSMSDSDAMALIEDIITCVNVFSSIPPAARARRGDGRNDIYIYAYKELTLYLRHLFVYYDTVIGELPAQVAEWPWYAYFKAIASAASAYSSITIVTYNYDIWLERLMRKEGLTFAVPPFEATTASTRFHVLKPHGSISFAHKDVRPKDAVGVAKDRELLDGTTADFGVSYSDLDRNFLVTAVIPPAGEAGRLQQTWANETRLLAKSRASALAPDDEVLICGLSYWHVDRSELDELLVAFDPRVNVRMINPHPDRSLQVVLTSIFDSYIAYNSSAVLKELAP